jgi:uncharacterized protein with HEPN domain
MKDEIRKHLIDILHAAEEIETFVNGMNFTAYKNSQITQRAVERNFEILVKHLTESGNLTKNSLKKYQNITV